MRQWMVAGGCLAVSCALRIPLRSSHLFAEDSVNFAMAVEYFDPRRLIPQPPGYPLFVLQSKLLNWLLHDVEIAFLAGVILGSAVALFFLFEITRDITGSSIAGALAAALLFVNPAFLFTGLTSPIRVFLAAVSLPVVWCCWRLWNRDRRFLWPSALVLGLGSGYRPELLLLLFPLWAISAWRAVENRRQFSIALAMLAASAGVWLIYLLSRFSNLSVFWRVLAKYVADQTRDYSPIYGATPEGWTWMLMRVVFWNGLAIAGWLAFAPWARPKLPSDALWILGLWIAPVMLFHAIVHVGASDQVLATIPAFAIAGGAVLDDFRRRFRDVGWPAIIFALGLNIVLFVQPLNLERGASGFRKHLTESVWETSWLAFKTVELESERVIRGIREAKHGRTLVIWHRSPVTWRKLSYYFPDVAFCLLLDDRAIGNRPHAALWQSGQLRDRFWGDPPSVPLNDAEQVLWVLGRDSAVRAAIANQLRPVGNTGVLQSEPNPISFPGYRLTR